MILWSDFQIKEVQFSSPLLCSCLENPVDRGAWWAAVYEVAQSWTWLKWHSSSSSSVQSLSHVQLLWPHGLQHARLPCLLPTPGVFSNSCPLRHWCCLTILSSATSFTICLQSIPGPRSFPMISSSHQVTKVLELQHQSLQWIFRVDFL